MSAAANQAIGRWVQRQPNNLKRGAGRHAADTTTDHLRVSITHTTSTAANRPSVRNGVIGGERHRLMCGFASAFQRRGTEALRSPRGIPVYHEMFGVDTFGPHAAAGDTSIGSV